MAKSKEKRNRFFFAFSLLLALVLGYFLLPHLAGFFLKSYAQRVFGLNIDYDSAQLNFSGAALKNVELKGKEGLKIVIGEASLDYGFRPSELKIFLISPHIILEKRAVGNLSRPRLEKFKSMLGRAKVEVLDGLLELKEQDETLKIGFAIKSEGTGSILLLRLNQSELQARWQNAKEGAKGILRFDEAEAQDFVKALSFFGLGGYDFKGKASGIVEASFKKGLEALSLNLDFEDADLTLPSYHLKAKNIHLETEKSSDHFRSSFEDFLKKARGLKLFCSFEGADIFTSDRCQFRSLRGTFSLHPGLSLRCRIHGKAQLGNFSETVRLEAKGTLKDDFKNHLAGKLRFAENSFIAFKARDVDRRRGLLDFEFKNIKKDELNIINAAALIDFAISSGEAEGNLQFLMKEGRIEEIFSKAFSVKDFAFKSEKMEAGLDLLCGGFRVKRKNGSFTCLKGNLKLRNLKADLASCPFHLKDGIADLEINEERFSSSSISFALNGAKTHFGLRGRFDSFEADIEQRGKVQDLLRDFDGPECYSLNARVEKGPSGYFIEGKAEMSCLEKEISSAAFGLSCPSLNIFSDPKQHLKELVVWLKGGNLLFDKWPTSFKGYRLFGKGDLALLFKNGELTLELQGNDLKLENSDFILACPKIGGNKTEKRKNGLFLRYDLAKEELFARMPTAQGGFDLKQSHLHFDFNEAFAIFKDSQLAFKIASVRSLGVEFKGSLYLNFLKNSPPKMDIDIENFAGKSQEIKEFLSHFGLILPLNCSGNLKGSAVFSKLLQASEPPFWQFDAGMEEISFELFQGARVKNFSSRFKAGSENRFFSLRDGFGKLSFSGGGEEREYDLYCPFFDFHSSSGTFDVRLGEKRWDFLRLAGSCRIEEEGSLFNIDTDKTNFFGMRLKKVKLGLDKNFHLNLLDLGFDAKKEELALQLKFLNDSFIFPGGIFFAGGLEGGAFHGRLKLGKKGALFALLSSAQFDFSGAAHRDFLLKGRLKGATARLSLGFDDWQAKADLLLKDNSWHLIDSALQKGNVLALNLSGEYSKAERVFRSEVKNISADLSQSLFSAFGTSLQPPLKGKVEGFGSLDIDLARGLFSSNLALRAKELSYKNRKIECRSPLSCSFSSLSGIRVSGIDFDFSSDLKKLFPGGLKIDEARADLKNRRWSLKGVKIATELGMIEDYVAKLTSSQFTEALLYAFKPVRKELLLDSSLDCEAAFDFSDFTLCGHKLQAGQVELNDVSLSLEPGKCYVDFRYLESKGKYNVFNELDLTSFEGKSHLMEEKDPNSLLAIRWACDKRFKIQSIEGALSGLDANFQLEENGLFGSVKIDFQRFSDFLPKESEDIFAKLQAGKGYELKGFLTLDPGAENWIGFKGLFSAKQFELFGSQFKTLQAKMDFAKEKLKIEDLKISDTAGILSVGQITLVKEKEFWRFSMPSLSFRDFRPSLIKMIGKELNPDDIKPLVVRELALNNFKGKLGDKKSFKGKGYLNFINSFKRGHTIFDFPAEVLGRIVGLDLDLLTPVKGRIDFVVKDARFNITSLEDSYSEGKRSKFFLFDKKDHAYIDFDGNIDISIKMKQYVLFKFTENFIISITGTLQDPKSNLKKRSFFYL